MHECLQLRHQQAPQCAAHRFTDSAAHAADHFATRDGLGAGLFRFLPDALPRGDAWRGALFRPLCCALLRGGYPLWRRDDGPGAHPRRTVCRVAAHLALHHRHGVGLSQPLEARARSAAADALPHGIGLSGGPLCSALQHGLCGVGGSGCGFRLPLPDGTA